MKTLAIMAVLASAMGLMAGCQIADSPALTAQERWQKIELDQQYDWEQVADDTDEALMLRPASHMSIWNVYHRD